MIKTFILSSAISLILASSGCPSGDEQTGSETSLAAWNPGTRPVMSFSYFRSSLSPYGRWFDDPAYGWCWSPEDVAADWRPYRDGYWADSDEGWTWVSAEPWGWATDHYGRWAYDSNRGASSSWIWIPGAVWAPAWVAWREGGDWIGWAPLPLSPAGTSGARPRALDVARIPAHEWSFVSAGHFTEQRLRGSLAPPGRNAALLARTQDASWVDGSGARPFMRGPARERIESRSWHPVRHVRIRDMDSPDQARWRPLFDDGTVRLFRPEIRPDGRPEVSRAREQSQSSHRRIEARQEG